MGGMFSESLVYVRPFLIILVSRLEKNPHDSPLIGSPIV